jgi:hypothetical protein
MFCWSLSAIYIFLPVEARHSAHIF